MLRSSSKENLIDEEVQPEDAQGDSLEAHVPEVENLENSTTQPINSLLKEGRGISIPFTPQESEVQDNASSLIQLFNSYSDFINNSSNVILDMDLVLDRLLDAMKKLRPPPNASSRITSIWDHLLDIDKESVENYASLLKNLPPNTLYDVLQNTERLYLKLAIEFDHEISRGKSLGIIKSDGGF